MSKEGNLIHVELSRRNLRSLLAKLDGHPPESACILLGGPDARGLVVKAVEDEEHYSDREPGVMIIQTEEALVRPTGGQ